MVLQQGERIGVGWQGSWLVGPGQRLGCRVQQWLCTHTGPRGWGFGLCGVGELPNGGRVRPWLLNQGSVHADGDCRGLGTGNPWPVQTVAGSTACPWGGAGGAPLETGCTGGLQEWQSRACKGGLQGP